MIVKATITVKSERSVVIDIPDGEYTEAELKQMADNDELLTAGNIIEEHDEYTGFLGTNIYDIDGKAV